MKTRRLSLCCGLVLALVLVVGQAAIGQQGPSAKRDVVQFTSKNKLYRVLRPGRQRAANQYRMKMNDRYKIPDETKFSYLDLLATFPYDYSQNFGGEGDMAGHTSAEMGGGLGRWLFHCHILHHAGLGMIGDLCVAPVGDPDARGCKIFVDPDIYEEF